MLFGLIYFTFLFSILCSLQLRRVEYFRLAGKIQALLYGFDVGNGV